MRSLLLRLHRDDDGATLVEYGLALALFSLGGMVALIGISAAASSDYSATTSAMQTFQTSTPP